MEACIGAFTIRDWLTFSTRWKFITRSQFKQCNVNLINNHLQFWFLGTWFNDLLINHQLQALQVWKIFNDEYHTHNWNQAADCWLVKVNNLFINFLGIQVVERFSDFPGGMLETWKFIWTWIELSFIQVLLWTFAKLMRTINSEQQWICKIEWNKFSWLTQLSESRQRFQT